MRRSFVRRAAMGVAFALLASSAARAADVTLRGTLLTTDFEPQAVQVVRLGGGGVEVIDTKSGRPTTLPLDRVLRIDVGDAPAVADGSRSQEGFTFVFRDGQRWVGTPGELKGDNLEFRPRDGEAKLVPLTALGSIVSRAGSATPTAGGAATADELLLANGDVATGVISASTADNVTLATSDGTPMSVDWANVRGVRFAVTGGAINAAPPAAFRLSLVDGRVIDGQSLKLDEEGLRLTSADAATIVPASQVVSIENRNGKARLLANVPPATASNEPYFPSQGVDGGSASSNAASVVTIAGRTTRSALVARPHSVMTWPLDGTAKTFVTRYGIPEGRPLADVTVRVKLDDAVVHEQAHVRAGQLSELIRVPLGAAKSLALEVDFGDTYDVQDDLHWVEPALLVD